MCFSRQSPGSFLWTADEIKELLNFAAKIK